MQQDEYFHFFCRLHLILGITSMFFKRMKITVKMSPHWKKMFSQKNPKEDKKGHLLPVNIHKILKKKKIFFLVGALIAVLKEKHAFSTKYVL